MRKQTRDKMMLWLAVAIVIASAVASYVIAHNMEYGDIFRF